MPALDQLERVAEISTEMLVVAKHYNVEKTVREKHPNNNDNKLIKTKKIFTRDSQIEWKIAVDFHRPIAN